MSNLLKVAMIETIQSLHGRGWSQRRIARELGIDRETVARHLKLTSSESNPANAPIGSEPDAAESNPANAPIGSEPDAAEPNPANAPIGSEVVEHAGRASECEPFRAVIVGKLEVGLSAQRIYQDLVAEYGFAGSYYSVRRFVGRLDAKQELPFRRIESAPGEEAQVDFGAGAPIVAADGKRRRTHVLRIVLSYSRKGFSEVVFRQTTDDFLRCLEDAFWHFGGVPQRLVLDNLRAAVTKADWFDPEINPQVQSFADYYGIVLMPTRPYMPRHKGKVERGIDYVQENALRGRNFASLEDQNRFLLEWERTVADTRLHGTTRKQVAAQFQLEKPSLKPLPDTRFPCFREVKRTVHRDGHVEVEKAYYSAPTEYLSRPVWVRYDARLVRIFDERMKLIATHVRHEPGRFSTHSSHIAGAKIACVERGLDWLMGRVRLIGPNSQRWAEAVAASRGIQAVRVLQGLLNLAKRHTSAALERACATAASRGADHLRTLRKLLEQPAPQQESLPFLDEHPLIRNLSEYGRIVETHDREVGDE
jgi:transposase